ncbi:MFS transporter [Elizabethkingia meningoseptica]|uniref:MFS transporter n=1 Tax=Elizabethkingia meningoseptica TaxID=238 RepID=UPI000332BCAE|nr:MFS transporter [Elizabethkingia meningoseptica]AQX06523.1 MFS transporter [Elizabethkingia meningoseptica]AQX48570.1 MFS transporter [Elizabethkingia meningoseptica]EJK5327978.1 MFS transporter [Elizabethkingia meningoseptica]EOR29578.1 hexuronate transporter [Elizabethkingia meningoseptica ATCC 13253 = NBRC 12535]KUY13623.1 MFS transporter [Elizabethkingia meningoseptica]
MEKSIGKYRWTICGLLFFATTINYLDRQVLSLLAPELTHEFGWSNSDYGNITAVFQFVYAISLLFAGRLIDKMGTKWGFAIAIVIWSLGAMMHAHAIDIGTAANSVMGWVGLASVPVSIVGFVIARAVLGIGESGNFPAAIKTTAEYFPKKERALATGIFNSGSNIGAILAPLTVPVLSEKYGWESTFMIIGGIGFIWLIFWFLIYESPEKQKRLSAEELAYIRSDVDTSVDQSENPEDAKKVSWFRLLQYKQAWAFAIGKFLTDGVWWFFLFWLPKYLEVQYHLTGKQLALPLFVLYSMTMVGSISGGWFPMYFIKKGYLAYDGRMRAMFFIALFPLAVLAAQPLGSFGYWVPVILIGIGASAHQAWSANIFTTVSDMFPRKTVASVTGIGGMAGGIGGVLISKIGGPLFDFYEKKGSIETGYTIMFTYCAIAYILAWSIMKLLVPKYKPITDL